MIHAHWKTIIIPLQGKSYKHYNHQCSNCLWSYTTSNINNLWNYCLNCGARLDGKREVLNYNEL